MSTQKKKTTAPVKKEQVKKEVKKVSKEQLKNKYEEAASRADSGDINRLKLEKGDNVVRIIDPNFEENFVCFVQDTDGKDRRISMGVNMKENKEKFSMLFDAIPDLRQQHKYYFKAVEGKTIKTDKGTKIVLSNEVKLFEIGPTIFKQIAAIQTDDEYPNIDEINLKIKRQGDKLKTEYQVMPSQKPTPLPADLVGDVDLEAMVAETALEEVAKIIGEEYQGTEDDEAEDVETEEAEEETEETEEAEEETEDDGLDGLDRDALKKYIKENGLSEAIPIYKKYTEDDLRGLIREQQALAAEGEEDEAEDVEVEEAEEETEVADDEKVEEDDDLADLDDLDDLADEEDEKPKKSASKKTEVKKPAPAPVKKKSGKK